MMFNLLSWVILPALAHTTSGDHSNSVYATSSDLHAASQYFSSGGSCHTKVTARELSSDLANLDYQLHSILSSVPAAITKARRAIADQTVDTNRDKFLIGIGCLLGAISGSLGVLYGQDIATLPIGQSFQLAAQNLWGYGYWAPFLFDLDDSDPGCGIEDFNKVVNEYSFLTSLYLVYRSDPGFDSYSTVNPDDRPELRKYYMGEFGRKLKLALFCITSKAGSVSEAGQVVNLIDKYVALGTERLDLTAKMMP